MQGPVSWEGTGSGLCELTQIHASLSCLHVSAPEMHLGSHRLLDRLWLPFRQRCRQMVCRLRRSQKQHIPFHPGVEHQPAYEASSQSWAFTLDLLIH